MTGGQRGRLSAASGPRLVVIGDAVLDREIEGRSDRLCPDAPAPVLDVATMRESPGAAGLAALLAERSSANVTLVAPIAADAAGDRLRDLISPRVRLVACGHQGPTRRKTRVRSAGQTLVRIDDGGPGTPTSVPVELIREPIESADAVLVSDYGAGVTADPRLRQLITAAAARLPVVWDPHPRGGRPVAGCALVTPNVVEARAALAGSDLDAARADRMALRLLPTWGAQAVCVTAGAMGAFVATADCQVRYVPAPAVAGGDPCGAGDSFAVAAAIQLARGALVSEAVSVAVVAAADWVGGGNRGLLTPLAAPDGSRSAGADAGADGSRGALTDLAGLSRALRSGSSTLVATGGCFDIVHAGHVSTLQAARRLGDALVVLINSDASVSRLKGPDRPVVGAADRARVLSALDCVDAVAIFDEDDPRQALSELRPDVWVKGGDYGGTPLPETDVVHSYGGRVVLVPYLSGRSTSTIIEQARLGRAEV